jgi:hypothetical protein
MQEPTSSNRPAPRAAQRPQRPHSPHLARRGARQFTMQRLEPGQVGESQASEGVDGRDAENGAEMGRLWEWVSCSNRVFWWWPSDGGRTSSVVAYLLLPRNEWTRMFPSRASDIGSDLPLIAVVADGEPGVSTVPESRLMGGWKKNGVVAKQYKLDTTVCGGNVDLDSFAN